MKFLLTALLFCLFFHVALLAQPEGDPIQIGESFSMHSDVLNQDRPYQVYLPDGYDHKGQPVAVMYLMDGDGHFHHTSGIVKFLIDQGRIPAMMIVAIPNTDDRTRDLTPPIERDTEFQERAPSAGQADNMLAFMKDELIPYIDQNYNTNAYRLLVGHSFGGIFTLEALLTQHELFDSYISISPSMWWDKQSLVDKAETFLKAHPDLEGYYYMTIGNEGGDMLGGVMKLAAIFEENAPPGFQWDYKRMEEETHGSVPHRSTYYGLVKIFEDWYEVDLAELYVQSGMLGVEKHYEDLSEKFGAEMKPSEDDWNNLGYEFLGRDNFDKAIEVFTANVEFHPESYNVYDSLAEAYKMKGDEENSIKYYKKSVSIHPGNEQGVKMLKEMGVDYNPMGSPLNLSGNDLQPYAGNFKLSDGSTVNFRVENDNLIAHIDGNSPDLTLVPVYENGFVSQPGNALVQFKESEESFFQAVTVQVGPGNTITGELLK